MLKIIFYTTRKLLIIVPILLTLYSLCNADDYDSLLAAGPPLSGEINTFNYYYQPQVDFYGNLHVGDSGMPWFPPYVPNATFRSYLTFLLDSLNVSSRIVIDSVKLRLWTHEIYMAGNDTCGIWPIWDVPGGDTIKLCIDHVDYGNYLDVGDWTAGNPGDPQTLQSKFCFITPEHYNPETYYFHIDVTGAVVNDINNQRDKSQFRIRFEVTTDMDSLYDFIKFDFLSPCPPYSIYYPTLLFYYYDSTAVNSHNESIINNDILLENYPNPFDISTIIKLSIPENIHKYNLSIYNIRGQLIKTFSADQIKREEGYYNVLWDGTDNSGQVVSSGVYLCKLQGKTKVRTKKLLLLK